MPRTLKINNRKPSGNVNVQTGEPVEITLKLTGSDAHPGDAWKVSASGGDLALESNEAVVPAGVTDNATLTFLARTGFGLSGTWDVSIMQFAGRDASLEPAWTVAFDVAQRVPQPLAAGAVHLPPTVAPVRTPTAATARPAGPSPAREPTTAQATRTTNEQEQEKGGCGKWTPVIAGCSVTLIMTLVAVGFILTFVYFPLRFAGIKASEADREQQQHEAAKPAK